MKYYHLSHLKRILLLYVFIQCLDRGPLFSSMTNKIIFIPVNKNKRETEENLLNNIFPIFEIIKIEEPYNHDLSISVIISMIYFINVVFSKFLIELSNAKEFQFEDNIINFFKKISGSSFKLQSLLSESILTDDVSLFNSLFIDNQYIFSNISKI